MTDDQHVPAGPRRGRIVMLVDNGVEGDSRVQKTARSAAEAGWEVYLLGLLGSASKRESWNLGKAQVRLVRVRAPLSRRPSEFSRSLLRRPLAYPPGPTGTYRINLSRVWRRELDLRLTEFDLARATRGVGLLRAGKRAGLLSARFAVRAYGRWAKFRAGELTRLQHSRANSDALFNRLPIAFWKAALGERSWRKLDPGLWNFELTMANAIDELRPDLIHANDFRMLGVGARAKVRGLAKGRDVKLVWDAHEFVRGLTGRPGNPRWLPAQIAHEQEYARYADAVITVSPTLAELLQETHKLPELPAVVLNTPARALTDDQRATPVPDLRELCGLGAQTPLLAYCGGVNETRGLETMIDALPSLPDVHVALVTLHPNGKTAANEQLEERAKKLGVADRTHFLPYVAYWQVSQFLSTADIGVIPIRHKPNHELALITKFFEYAHARLPIVVSDVRTIAETTRSVGQGEVFRADDVADYVRAVKAVLADPARYRAAYDKPGLLEGWTWEAQAKILDAVYSRLLPARPAAEGVESATGSPESASPVSSTR